MKKAVLAVLATAVALAGCGGMHQSATGSVHPVGWGGTPKGVALPAPGRFGAAPTRTMYDSVSESAIPSRPFAAAGYTAGKWPTWAHIRALATHAVSIAIHVQYHADCLDDEPGDATPAQAGPWAVADIKAGFKKPCVYSDLSEMPQVKASLRAWLGSNWRSRVFLWLAWYRKIPGLVTGYDAVQYDDTCLGRNLDCSTVSLGFLTIAQPPYVAPKPPPPRPICFGPRARPRSATCKQIRSKVARWTRAENATAKAIVSVRRGLSDHHCRTPYRRDVCVDLGRETLPTLRARTRYFANRTAATIKEYS